jgi:GNAT superfamily N-acetyltransferase
MELVERLPTTSEFVALLRAVGWPSPAVEDCERALAGTLAAVCAVDEGVVVGMGRLVGDGGLYCLAVDVVVDPGRQGRGIGRAIVERLEAAAVERRLGARLDLVAAPEVASFYRRLGYASLEGAVMRKQLEPPAVDM